MRGYVYRNWRRVLVSLVFGAAVIVDSIAVTMLVFGFEVPIRDLVQLNALAVAVALVYLTSMAWGQW